MSAGINMKIEATGFENIEKEAKRILTAAVGRKLSNAVYEDMKSALEAHIRSDVYDAYYPKMYKRRSERPGARGTSLADSVYDDSFTKQIGPFDYATAELISGLSYEPTGEHEETWQWSDASGDELIGRIEKKNPPYNWEPKKGEIPKRPFWQLFVEELIEGGRIARTVEAELKRLGIAEPEDHISGVVRQSEDGNY